MAVQTKIAEYLKEKGIKKKFVADKAGIKNYRLSHILHNQSEMRADEFERICKALEVTPEKFFEWQPEK
ncbi:MAG: helix-turn-helix transcriptional regulator [Methanobrevibacter sp.]|nr:helix-turn-helix transcriptional regulator [Methanobrevibacter sp.]